MAVSEDGELIDLFDGKWALENRILLTPRDAKETMLDDPLRLLRAFRFSITKDFSISPRIMETCLMDSVVDKLEQVVSQERIREEILKMMKHDTLRSLELIERIRTINPKLVEIIFGRGLWLKPTFEL
jgi:tRNA nucleotidyltransferase (CCA-adding enzyme)